MAYGIKESIDEVKEAAHPMHQAEELLHLAKGEIAAQKVSSGSELAEIMRSISKAAEHLAQIRDRVPSDPASLGAVSDAMNQLRDVLGSLQIIAGDHTQLEGTAKLIAKTLAILYPLSKFGESRIPASPAPSEPLPPQILERRKAKRMCIEAEIGFQSETNFFMGFSEDISTGGLFIATYDTRPMGSLLNVNFTLPSGHLISADGVVRWVREYNETTPETPPGMGIQFEHLRPQDKEAIEMFVNQRPAMFYDVE